MSRFMTFVNGSNLFGAFKHLEVFVDDYESLYRFIFSQTADRWRDTFDATSPPQAQHVRVYWYVVDQMDEWDLENSKTRQHLAERFQEDREVKNRWIGEATKRLAGAGANTQRVEQTAFAMCYEDFTAWYAKKEGILGGMNRFHYAVEASSTFIDIERCGRWKVDLMHKTLNEKGVDVCFAVDLLTLQSSYDVAILVGADADGVPGVESLKRAGKQVAVVDLVKGSPAGEGPARSFATPLKLSADFVVPIYEAELVRLGIAKKGEDRLHLRDTD
ncbi:MAG: NYN domain-containing protein [Armatimonadota bacterium]